MLILNNLLVTFNQQKVLNHFSATINKGDFIVIVGANGSGKSTLFNTIAGKTKPHTGSIELDGADITSLPEQSRANMITHIFQNPQLNSAGSLTVAQNITLANLSRRHARLTTAITPQQKEHAHALLQRLNINASVLDTPMSSLSGGQRQLIAFGMATQAIPKLLLLDEPTAALDPQAATTLLKSAAQFIKDHNITTLLITHDPHIALILGNKIWVLKHGQIASKYDQSEKAHLKPDELIGQIDYQALAP